MTEILRCGACGNFTLKKNCSCGGTPVSVIPMKYTLQDKYASYRRTAKEQERKTAGIL
ncbi:MAG: ribosome biogenesis protein [Candidatus Aenigmarchaeota archaeon]|nr:ribosome biogenesis protein [Candidatus Aenigmarchaeota archaeon]